MLTLLLFNEKLAVKPNFSHLTVLVCEIWPTVSAAVPVWASVRGCTQIPVSKLAVILCPFVPQWPVHGHFTMFSTIFFHAAAFFSSFAATADTAASGADRTISRSHLNRHLWAQVNTCYKWQTSSGLPSPWSNTWAHTHTLACCRS